MRTRKRRKQHPASARADPCDSSLQQQQQHHHDHRHQQQRQHHLHKTKTSLAPTDCNSEKQHKTTLSSNDLKETKHSPFDRGPTRSSFSGEQHDISAMPACRCEHYAIASSSIEAGELRVQSRHCHHHNPRAQPTVERRHHLRNCLILMFIAAISICRPSVDCPTSDNRQCYDLLQSIGVDASLSSQAQAPRDPPFHRPSSRAPPSTSNSYLPEIISQQGGIIKDKNVTLTKQYNPILISKDIIIKRDAKLTIEHGVELLFEKTKGIIVYGTLEILGQPDDKVKLNLLKSQHSATVNLRSQNNNFLFRQQVRLVDGDWPNEGRVQIKFNDRWHSLCTNSKNLTAADIRVLCQQVGYQDGHWYKWFPRRNETSASMAPQLMSKSFHCSGAETTLSQCKRWNRVRAGGGICDNHSDLGIRCSRKLVFHVDDDAGNGGQIRGAEMPTFEFWRGIEFINSETFYEYVLEGQMKQRVSKSILKHITIGEAGLNQVGNATAALRALGQPPRMTDLEIRNSVYGIMIEEADDAIQMKDIRLFNNMASPLFINSSWGKISLDGVHVENNGGDAGIRIARHERLLVGSHDFCKFANLGSSQSFPVILSHEQTFFATGQECCQEFLSTTNQLTVHFAVLRSTPNNLRPESDNNRRVSIPNGVSIGRDANLVIYDDYRDEFPFRLSVQNGTRAQSIVSKFGRLKICYEPALFRTVLFTIEVVADVDDEWSGRARDVEISNSLVRNNEGRGIWIENQRSGVRLFNTSVLNHNYLAGFHAENGTGEVIIQASTIANNSGHGLLINLAGGYYHIDNSTIVDNSLKGIAIEYDKRPELVPFNHTFHLGFSLVARNGENGLFLGNVCRSDAFWNISMNSFVGNGEDALFFQSCLPSTAELVGGFASKTSRLNLTAGGLAYRHQQQHQDSHSYQELLITHNVFVANFRRAINMSPIYFVRAFVRHNLFREHPLAVIQVSNNNLLVDDNLHALAGGGGELDLDLAAQAPASVRIASNRFLSNQGRYVANLGLLEDSSRQSITFTKNTLEDNSISEPYADLRPRSRVSAVVVVSSSNTRVVRNRFNNPLSAYELGSHLEQHSRIINATANFWGRKLDASSIYRRIFDRKNRYNLAQVEFLQYLLSPEDLEYPSVDLSFDRERDKISTFRNGSRLGGEVKGYEELGADTYTVWDDIYVRPGAHLTLKAGTVLKFQDGVGMMVQGRLDALGQPAAQIVLTSATAASRAPQRAPLAAATTSTTSTASPLAHPWVSHQPDWGAREEEDSQVRPALAARPSAPPRASRIKRQVANNDGGGGAGGQSAQNVRLSHTTMGRLEVQIDGSWGSVCDYNFDIHDAAVVCQQLGMVLNRDDWLLQRFQFAANDRQQVSMMVNNVLMTNVRCDPTLDTDITRCKAELSSRGDFDGLCNYEVGLRCFPPSWSGVRLGMAADISTLEHVTIQRAGMFDYAAYSLRPALQIDFNRHWISSLAVKSNSDSGLGILWNDVIGRHSSELSISESRFTNNERHGIELRSRGLSIRNSLISNNRQHGLDYNPSFSHTELTDLLSWLETPKNSESHIVALAFPLLSSSSPPPGGGGGGGRHFSIASSEDSYKFFVVPRNPQPDVLGETFTIGTDPGHMLSIHLLSPIQPDSTEELSMSIGLNPESPVWDFRVNMTSFPMVSPGYKFHFNYSSGSRPRGQIVLYVRSRYSNRDLKILNRYIPNHLVAAKFDQTAANINSRLINSIVIHNSTISRNAIGLKFRQPNYPFSSTGGRHSNHRHQHHYNVRYHNETTNITSNLFEGNHFSSIFVSSDEFGGGVGGGGGSESLLNRTAPPLIASSEIRYHVLGNRIRRNADGIRQFSRDIRYTSNVFHWTINDTQMEHNKAGGIGLVLPYFWPYDANLSHTIEMHNNSFVRNQQFEVSLEGHFVVLNMAQNVLRENRCKNSLVYFGGMEKQLLIRDNFIEFNTCSRIIEFDIQSHADKLGAVEARLSYNALRFNRRIPTNASHASFMSAFPRPKLMTKLHPQASDFALSMRGVQPLNISRNLFVNPELRFELIVGIIMDPSERTVNALENYWGSVLAAEIGERIFDFDDWNSYAIAEISPYLTQDSFTAATMIAAESRTYERNQPKAGGAAGAGSLGGRLSKSMVLPWRREPYLVESDWTIMPGVRLTIERGVVLEFMPYVGMLVLGDLMAAGTRDQPIQMRPALSAADVAPLRQYLLPSRVVRPPSLVMSHHHHGSLNSAAAGADPPIAYENGASNSGHYYAFRHYHQFAYPLDLGSVRLCKNEICNDGSHIYENNIEEPQLRQEVLRTSNSTWKMDGFLEIFNMSSLQWVPVCDPLFTEHGARVVCRQLGYSHLAILKRGRRLTIEQEQISSTRNWPESVQCLGDEPTLASCPLLPLGYTNHSTACTRDGNQFVYVHCSDHPDATAAATAATTTNHQQPRPHGATDEHAHHWGGLRFACPTAAATASNGNNNGAAGGLHESRDSSFETISQEPRPTRSRLQYVIVDRAGMLHREKSPAVQVLQCTIQAEYMVISNSAHHGLELIASQGNQNLHQLRIRDSLGVGLNYLSLTGSSSAATKLVPYLPLKHVDISSDIFGLVDVCGANKEIQLDDRLLMFYRYRSQPVDCVKIISSRLPIKRVGIRMLRFDLFNSTSYTHRPDYVRIYDGDLFDRDSRLLAELGVTERHRLERPELKFYQTSDSKMTVRVHASGASRMYGFIAELVTTPVSYNIQRDSYNNITYSELANNRLGALAIASAGESSPNLILKNNRFDSNCMHLFGNFTSCASSIYMELQNCQRLRVINNLMRNNAAGGLTIKSYSHSAVSALEALIENNVFEANSNSYTLALIGPKTDPYQSVRMAKNYFTRNDAGYRSNVLLAQVIANFSRNIMSGNAGKHQIEVIGFDKLPLSYQIFHSNWIYNNLATLELDKSTIFSNSAGQQFSENYLVNADNHFELSTMNWSRYDVKPLQTPRDDDIIHLSSGDGSSKDLLRKSVDAIPFNVVDTRRINLYHASIDARANWWGFSASSAIQSRIRDRVQHEELLKVDFSPPLDSNRSLLSGVCAGGWHRVADASCLLYIGSKMTFHEAREFCDRERATIPLLSRASYDQYTDFIRSQDREFDARIDRVWVRSFSVGSGREGAGDACPALNDYRTKNYDCLDKNSFLCEKDPQVVVSLWHWHLEIGGLVALVMALITLLLSFCCTVCWAMKSRERHREKLERKHSIRASTMMRKKCNNNNSNSAGGGGSGGSMRDFVFNSPAYYDAAGEKQSSSIITTDALSLSTQLSASDGMNLIRSEPSPPSATTSPAYKRGKASPSSHRPPATVAAAPKPPPPPQPAPLSLEQHEEDDYQQQQQQQHLPSPSYANVRPPAQRNAHRRDRQPSMDPAYTKSVRPMSSPPPPPPARQILTPAASQLSIREKPPTPAPSYREIHPRALSAGGGGSRTPSYAGSQHGSQHEDDHPIMEPMPGRTPREPSVLPPPPPPIAYSQIRHQPMPSEPPVFGLPPPSSLQQGRHHQQQESSPYKRPRTATLDASRPQPPPPPPPPPYNTRGTLEDESTATTTTTTTSPPSTIPTFYSTEADTYEESSHSYIEAYNNAAYNKTLQRLNNDDSSFTLTERSSTTDLLMNFTSQLSPHIDDFYNRVVAPNLASFGQQQPSSTPAPTATTTYTTRPAAAAAATNLVSMKPQAASSHYIVDPVAGSQSSRFFLEPTGTGRHSQHFQQSQPAAAAAAPPAPLYSGVGGSSRALSERVGSLGTVSQANQYCVETSLDDLEAPDGGAGAGISLAPEPTFGGSSQRLSPVSASSYAPSADSKLGSRVYLQTSF